MIVWFKKKTQYLFAVSGNPLLYIALLAVIMVLFTLYKSVTQISLEDVDAVERSNDKPRATIQNALIHVFNKQGALAYRVQADSIDQYENPERSVLYNAEVRLLDENKQIQWSLQGNQVEYSSQKVLVEGDVTIANIAKNPPINVETQRLEYNVEEKIVILPSHSDVYYGDSFVQSGSARIDIEKSLFQFNNKVVVTFNVSEQ